MAPNAISQRLDDMKAAELSFRQMQLASGACNDLVYLSKFPATLCGLRVVLLLQLPHVLDESLLVCLLFYVSFVIATCRIRKEETNHASIFAIAEDADVPQAEFHEALVHEVHWRVNIQSHRCLLNLLVCCLRQDLE